MSDETQTFLRQACLWAGCVACAVMAAACAASTFFGPRAPERWFTSPLGAGVWLAFGALLALSMLAVRSIRRRPALLVAHAGLVLIVAGALWGSETAHELRARWGGEPKVPGGYLFLSPGQTGDVLYNGAGMPVGRLPVRLTLEAFRVEHYPPRQPWLSLARLSDPNAANVPSPLEELSVPLEMSPVTFEPDVPTRLPWGCGTVRLLEHSLSTRPYGTPVRVRLRLRRRGRSLEMTLRRTLRGPVIYRLEELYADGAGWRAAGAPALCVLPYNPHYKEYVSRVVARRNGQVVARKAIEVNDPLHVGGYHLYQRSFGEHPDTYTVLEAVSDSGLLAVYAGYACLVGGLGAHLAVRLARLRRAKEAGR